MIYFSELARELDFTEEQIHQIRIENPNSLQDQSHALLKYWLERDGKHATGSLPVIVHLHCLQYTSGPMCVIIQKIKNV